jgi:hypothetical protein
MAEGLQLVDFDAAPLLRYTVVQQKSRVLIVLAPYHSCFEGIARSPFKYVEYVDVAIHCEQRYGSAARVIKPW